MTEQLRLRRTGEATGDGGVQAEGDQTVLPVVLVHRPGLDQDESHVGDHAEADEAQLHEGVGQLLYVHLFEALFDAFETVDEEDDECVLELGVDDDVETHHVQEGHEGGDGW